MLFVTFALRGQICPQDLFDHPTLARSLKQALTTGARIYQICGQNCCIEHESLSDPMKAWLAGDQHILLTTEAGTGLGARFRATANMVKRAGRPKRPYLSMVRVMLKRLACELVVPDSHHRHVA